MDHNDGNKFTPKFVKKPRTAPSDSTKSKSTGIVQTPRRLKGPVLALVVRMQKLHMNCAYAELLKYYCPSSVCLLMYCSCMSCTKLKLFRIGPSCAIQVFGINATSMETSSLRRQMARVPKVACSKLKLSIIPCCTKDLQKPQVRELLEITPKDLRTLQPVPARLQHSSRLWFPE